MTTTSGHRGSRPKVRLVDSSTFTVPTSGRLSLPDLRPGVVWSTDRTSLVLFSQIRSYGLTSRLRPWIQTTLKSFYGLERVGGKKSRPFTVIIRNGGFSLTTDTKLIRYISMSQSFMSSRVGDDGVHILRLVLSLLLDDPHTFPLLLSSLTLSV